MNSGNRKYCNINFNYKRNVTACPATWPNGTVNTLTYNDYTLVKAKLPLNSPFNYLATMWYADIDELLQDLTALAVFTLPGDGLIVAIGDRRGRLLLHNFNSDQKRERTAAVLELGAGAVVQLSYDAATHSLLTLSERGVRSVAIEEFCAAAATCGECATRHELQCGWCSGR